MAFSCTRLFAPMYLRSSQSVLLRGLRTSPRPLVSMKVVPFKPQQQEGHDERNMRLNRPLSPHLLIYAPQLTSILSITHRGTGLALTGYMTGIALGALLLPQPLSAYLAAASLSSATVFAGKFIMAFPFAYHFVNGVRHLVWDMGKALTIKQVYSTGYIMIGVSAVLTLLLMGL
ncbi:hypothetical protein ONE63_000707 [Megalurothrips usitatus]|uniref:Succinate dehydrogenase cytochrome b560 subunit, mitochondrial n=1 Tax=Megalurothrips usitatus TaxID=439358 RepID=A0AAV7Y329_9NEOP|nr:hypothetical protein ONE63_000707 [Megalurothrips usitatus]